MLPADGSAAMMPPELGGYHDYETDACHARGTRQRDRDRHVAAADKDKRRILEEFVAATGYHEKSAIRVLNTPSQPTRRQTRQRPANYDEAARAALIVLREASDRVCSKRLRARLSGQQRIILGVMRLIAERPTMTADPPHRVTTRLAGGVFVEPSLWVITPKRLGAL